MSVTPQIERGVLIVPPVAITTAMLQVGDMPVPTPGVDPEVWTNKAWAKDELCCVPATRRVYKRKVAGTTAVSPEEDAVNWFDYSAVNADLMFDEVIGTQTQASGSIVRVIKPGEVITSIALLNVDGVQAHISMSDPSGDHWERTYNLVTTTGITDWFAWHFRRTRRKRMVLALDVPPYSDATWTITITSGPGESARCGVLLLGYGQEIGYGLEYGASIGRVNYSTMDFDVFGNPKFVERPIARRAKFSVPVSNKDIDFVADYIDGINTKSCLVIGYEGLACTVLYGIVEDFSVVIPHPGWSDCDLNMKGFI